MSDEAQKEEIVVPEKFQKLVAQIEAMSVLDLSELVKILEKKFGVSAAAQVAVAVAPASAEATAGKEEKSSFDVELTSAGASKIAVIKVVREVTDLGLKEAKDLVDAAPKLVKEGLKPAEAAAIKKKLEEAGATVTLK